MIGVGGRGVLYLTYSPLEICRAGIWIDPAGRGVRHPRRVSMGSSPEESRESCFGSPDLRLPEGLRGPLRAHLSDLREKYLRRGWAGRVGFGSRPALVVIDLARFWLD